MNVLDIGNENQFGTPRMKLFNTIFRGRVKISNSKMLQWLTSHI